MIITKFMKSKTKFVLKLLALRSVKSPKGFTLIETLAAVTILFFAVVGPIYLIGNSLHKIYYAKDQVIAISLAQEGIEMVRHVRDSNRLGLLGGVVGVFWDTGISVGSYLIDAGSFISMTSPATNSFIVPCVGCVLPQPVYLDMSANPTKGLYRQNVSGPTFLGTNFSRIVKIESINNDELRIVSKVEWKTGGTTGTITVSEYLFKLEP